MPYQPLYATVRDNQGGFRQSSSRTGRVNSIGLWLNSFFGEVITINAKLREGKKEIPKPDLRRFAKEEREGVMERYEEDCEAEDMVSIDISIPANKKFRVRLNGITISFDQLKNMEKLDRERFEQQIQTMEAMMGKSSESPVNKIAQVIECLR